MTMAPVGSFMEEASLDWLKRITVEHRTATGGGERKLVS